jgi:hypothetical protein
VIASICSRRRGGSPIISAHCAAPDPRARNIARGPGVKAPSSNFGFILQDYPTTDGIDFTSIEGTAVS